MSLSLKSKDDIAKVITAIYLKYNPFFNVFINTNQEASSYHNYIHQMYLMARLAFQRPIRIMIADEIGLGKTIEAIRVLKHLKFVDQIKKILITVPPILLDQWIEKDLRTLDIRPTIIDKNNIQDLYKKAKLGLINEGVFIGSMDKLKLSESDKAEITRYPYFEFINSVHWDLVIIDEAHKLSYMGGPSLRYERLGSIICKNAEHYVLLTATPHRGKTEDFLSRLILLDDSFIPSPSELGKNVEALGLRTTLFQLINDVIFFRRVKEDVNKLENKQIFKPAHQYPVLIYVPEEIRKLQLKILDFVTIGIDNYYFDPRFKGIRELLRKLIIKRAMSSEEALLKTFMKIGAKRGGMSEEELERLSSKLEEYLSGEELETEIDTEIESFVESVSSFIDSENANKMQKEIKDIIKEVREIIDQGKSPKINALADIIDLALGKSLPNDFREKLMDIKGGRIIVFTEFKDTAHQVFTQLQKVLENRSWSHSVSHSNRAEKLKKDYLTLTEAPNEVLNYFNIIQTPDGKLIGLALLASESKKFLPLFQRMLEDNQLATTILISTDVAAEGLNMQTANIVVNYEVTWSPMKRDQRVGRVWRLGQKRDVYVFDFHMGTEFERSLLENFTIKIITATEESGFTTLQFKGLAFYIPHILANEEESFALRVVELEKFNESSVLDDVAIALKKAFSPKTLYLDEKIVESELSRLAADIIRFAKQLKNELEVLSKFRASPDKVRKEVKLLLGFEDEKDALKAATYLLMVLTQLGLVKVQDQGNVIYVNGQKANKNSLRDFVDVLYKVTRNYLNISFNVNNLDKPTFMLVTGSDEFESAFLTFIITEYKTAEEGINKLLYIEPILLINNKEGTKVLRGSELLTKLQDILSKADISTIDNATFKAISGIYSNTAERGKTLLEEISRILHDKPENYIKSKDLSKLRLKSPTLIPNGIELRVVLTKKPLAVFISFPYDKLQIQGVVEQNQIPILTPSHSVSPEKKEEVKIKSESLVKAYFESLGFKVIKRSEYTHYDFELYDNKSNLVSYVEVKGHETSEPTVELTQEEYDFALQNKDKYIVCVVTEALTNPRLQCVSFDDLQKIKVYKIEVLKYIYKLKEEDSLK